ncbi:MAG: hypothetical protein ACM3XZ_10890 [Betaproteobacteria bacterium]
MSKRQSAARVWAGYLVGMLTESAYVAVLLAVAGLVALAVMAR